MAILEGTFLSVALNAVVAVYGFWRGDNSGAAGAAAEAIIAALPRGPKKRAEAQARTIQQDLQLYAASDNFDPVPVATQLDLLLARHGLSAAELIDLNLEPRRAAERVMKRGGDKIEQHLRGPVENCLEAIYRTLTRDPEFLQGAQADILGALLSHKHEIQALPSATATAIRALLAGNLLETRQKLLPENPRDTVLLRADYGAVPFDPGRGQELDELLTWCRGDGATGVRLMTGVGGIGKTRLARELGHRLRLDDWHAGFLHDQADGAPDYAFDELFADDRHLLIMVDEAATRQATVIKLLHRLNTPLAAGKRRILLLSRTAGDWWPQLQRHNDTLLDLFDRLDRPATEMAIHALADTAGARDKAFDAALAAFSKKLGGQPPAGTRRPDLSRETFGRALFLHMAALGHLRGDQPAGEQEMLENVLKRERGHWSRALRDAGLITYDKALTQSAALLTLVRGTSTGTEARSLLRRLPLLARESSDVSLDNLIRILAELYPGQVPADDAGREDAGRGIAGVRPDLLGEHLVGQEIENLIDAGFGDGASRAMILNGLTVLNRLAARQSEKATGLTALFERHAARVAEPALEVATEEGDPIGRELARWIEDNGRTDVADLLYAKLPYPTVALSELALVVTEHRVSAKRAQTEDTEDPDRRSDLATSLSNLGIRLSALGRREEALDATEEAVRLRRTLAAKRPDAFNSDLARSLSNLGIRLGELGRREEALAASEEAVRLYRELAEKRPDAFNPDLARSLWNCSDNLAALDRMNEALAENRVAIEILRPYFLALPATHADLMRAICTTYREKCDLSGAEPNRALLDPIEQVLGRISG
ncbi:MAG: tetratricopeptide repeat protein [Geminicoccaceae bacterium]